MKLLPTALLLALALPILPGCRRAPPEPEATPRASPAEAPPSDPAARETLRREAHMAVAAADWPRAEAALLSLWRSGDDPASLRDGSLVAHERARRGQVPEAVALLDEAEARRLPLAHRLDVAAAVVSGAADPSILERLPPTGGPVSVGRMALAAFAAERAGDEVEARAIWRAIDRRVPDEPEILRALVRVQTNTGRLEDLEQALQRLLAVDPDDEAARRTLRHVQSDGASTGP